MKELLDLAGMTNARGRLGNPIPPGYVRVPGVIELDEIQGIICWKDPVGSKAVKPPEDLVQAFAELFDAQPSRLLEFAQRYGVLGFGEDGHLPKGQPSVIAGLEPVERWRALASEVRSVLRLAAMLHKQDAIGPEIIAGDPAPRCSVHGINMAATLSWKVVSYICPIQDCDETEPFQGYGPIGEWAATELHAIPSDADPNTRDCFWFDQAKAKRLPFPTDKKKRAKIAQFCLDWTISEWLFRFPSTISMERNSVELELVLDYRFGLLSVIALQLLQAVARRAVYFCSECKNPFVRLGGSKMERRPKSGMDRFCDKCGRPAAMRRADARRRERIGLVKQLHADGMSVQGIISELGIKRAPPSTVRRWIKEGK